jgi:IclR family pca regulon transcriptional regulator
MSIQPPKEPTVNPAEAAPAVPAEPKGRVEHVQSLERGLAVLSAFTARDTALTISQVADRTSLSRATARRLLLTLEKLGYVESTRREFSLTPAVLDLAKPFAGPIDPWGFAKPYLHSQTEPHEESASIAVLDGTDILYVARTPTRRLMTLAVTVGSRLPAHATSKGRILLAFLPEAELEAYFRRSAIEPYTDRTVVGEAELRSILAGIRAEGWAIVDQQLEEGLCSVAAPIIEPSGRVSAALSVCAHAGRVDPNTLRTEFLPLVLETARRISALRTRR